jgi:hypothetical protein
MGPLWVGGKVVSNDDNNDDNDDDDLDFTIKK